MSIGKIFDTVKEGISDTVNSVTKLYEPGKLGTTTKIVLTICSILAIFYVVGALDRGDESE